MADLHTPSRRLLGGLLTTSLAVILAACSSSGAASPAPSSGASAAPPSAAPSAAPSQVPVGTIDHPTGATDVILRYDEGGGFVMPAFAATMVPWFTLYGDGTIVFRNPNLPAPEPQGSIYTQPPMRTAKLSEEQIQNLLAYALTEGGLAGARDSYENMQVADASTAIFTITADGHTKKVSVYALGMEPPPAGQPGGADGPARLAFQKLAAKLTDIDSGGTIPSDVYQPTAYRGLLMDGTGMTAPDIKDWPWKALKVADFAPDADPNGLQFPHRTMTPAEVEALGVTGPEGGVQGALLHGTDGKTYSFSLRPLLPDEKA
jgi:hypothetical protein